MDHQPSGSDRVGSRAAIAGRLRLIRSELFGEQGGPELADQLGLPFRTWSNYESGVPIPGEVVLEFLEITGTRPAWLLGGEGRRYRTTPDAAADARVLGDAGSAGRAAPVALGTDESADSEGSPPRGEARQDGPGGG